MTSLILEGGGMRGVYTAGVLDCFLDNNIEFDACFGVSAGACNAASFLARQRGRGYATFTEYLDNKEYCSIESLVKTGDLFGEQFVYHKIPEELYPIDNETFKSQNTKFYSVVTNCITGKAEYIEVKDLIEDVECIRASSSLPMVSREVMINATPYLDGGISDSIPVKKSVNMGYNKNIVILTREPDYTKEASKLASLMKIKYRKYPELVKRIKQRHINYNTSVKYIKELEKEGKVFLIQPETALTVGRIEKNRDKLKAAYDTGYNQAKDMISEIVEYLK